MLLCLAFGLILLSQTRKIRKVFTLAQKKEIKKEKMKTWHYFLLAIALVFICWFGYQRYVVIVCTNEARESIRDKKLDALEGKQVYDVYYRACTGRKGIER